MSHRTLLQLKRKLKARGITQDAVAREASVGRTLVTHVLAGRAKSANVLRTVKRLISAAPEPGDGQHG